MPEERSIDSSRRPVIPTTLETGPGRTPEPPFHGPISSCPLSKKGFSDAPILGGICNPYAGGDFGGLRMERDGGRSEVADLLKKNFGKRAAVGIGKGQESGDMKGFAGNGALSLYIIVRSPFSRGFSQRFFPH